jgi:hypothetical protein
MRSSKPSPQNLQALTAPYERHYEFAFLPTTAAFASQRLTVSKLLVLLHRPLWAAHATLICILRTAIRRAVRLFLSHVATAEAGDGSRGRCVECARCSTSCGYACHRHVRRESSSIAVGGHSRRAQSLISSLQQGPLVRGDNLHSTQTSTPYQLA